MILGIVTLWQLSCLPYSYSCLTVTMALSNSLTMLVYLLFYLRQNSNFLMYTLTPGRSTTTNSGLIFG
jgi:hypothetical protein